MIQQMTLLVGIGINMLLKLVQSTNDCASASLVSLICMLKSPSIIRLSLLMMSSCRFSRNSSVNWLIVVTCDFDGGGRYTPKMFK